MRKPGDQISRYIVESVLGSGGMGDVYEALDTRLERKVALKLVRSEGKQAHAQRLLREARAIAAFEHPNAVVIYDVGETEGEMFIAMELVRGRPLRHFIGDASIPLGRKLRWLVDAARALGAAHRAGLIHRDVKPDNIMVRNDGVVKVLDFGIARLASGNAQKNALGDSATVTAEGTLIGTPRYLAPEQLRGEDLDGRTDEFAWAVTAYELLTGEAPFSGETSVALLSKILTSTPKSLALPDAPPALEQALFRAMAKRPEERFESIDDAADALEAFADAPTDRNRIPKESPSLPGLSPANTAPDPSSKVCCDPETSRPSPSKLGSSGTGKSQKRITWLGAGAALLALGAGTFYATRPSKPLQSQATASEIAPAALIVSSLGCEASVIEGGQPVADLDRVIGYAACGRLAIELGVSFGREKPSHKLSVRTRLSDSGAELTLGIGDKTATAKAKTPLEAIVEAIPKLTSQLAPAPLAPEEIARWGAKDAEGARRIRKTWLRMILDYETDDQAAVRELLRTDPDSARTHMLALVAELGTAENQKTHAARVRELLEKLPPAQANYMRNALHNRGFPDPSNPSPKEPVSIRKAFTEDPQDTVLMTMLAIDSLRNNAKEEGYALQDRLWKQSPAEAAWSMHFMCTWTPERRDFEREAKYLELAWQHIPEVLTWDLAISHYFHTNQLPKARHSIQLGLQLGLASGVSGSFYFDTGRAWLELATWSPKEAREIANWMMGIPRPMVATWGANVLAASYFFEGRIIDGMNLMARRLDAEDEANAKNNKLGVRIASDLTQRLWLPLPLPSKERLERMRFLAMTDEGHGISELNNLYMELLRMHHDPKHPKQKAEQYLKDVEAHITAMPDLAPEKRAQFTLWTLPAIRRLKGNEEAVKLWHASQTAPFASRRAMALEAGLAFLGVAKVEEAEAALKLAENPHQIEMQSLSAIIARIRRGALYRSQNRIAEAEALEKQIGELWINADPGMRAYFEKLK